MLHRLFGVWPNHLLRVQTLALSCCASQAGEHTVRGQVRVDVYGGYTDSCGGK